MSKIKLTKGELKRQRDALRQFERYLPTLQLKKQQLQMEILHQEALVEESSLVEKNRLKTIEIWAGLLNTGEAKIEDWIHPRERIYNSRNIAGVEISVFEKFKFDLPQYDLFNMPLWVDHAVEAFREISSLREEIRVLKKGIEVLREELRVTAQRVNLFEKVKIPETEEAIRLIKIYLGDQMANAVGRSKIAKRKISEAVLAEVVL
ncbi:MAG: V-type ATP synthase subunit D [Candidatus Omnitrophica bacterium]|nr:V-type ATP synthase subunit D [Candidatus Omnitrophota bacterium]